MSSFIRRISFSGEQGDLSRVGGEDPVPLYPEALSQSYLCVRLHLQRQQGYTVTPSSLIAVDLLHRELSPLGYILLRRRR